MLDITRTVAVVTIASAFMVSACDSQKSVPSSNKPVETSSAPEANTKASETPLEPTPAAEPAPTVSAEKARPIEKEAASVSPQGKAINCAGFEFTAPEGWTSETPSSQMRLAQYSLPGEAGAAELAVFHFGPQGGGPRDQNVQRWVGQFQSPEGADKAVNWHSATIDANELTHTVVTVTGTYAPAPMGPNAPRAEPKENYALYGVILEGGSQGPLYIAARGPEETIKAQTAALEAFHMSARLAKP